MPARNKLLLIVGPTCQQPAEQATRALAALRARWPKITFSQVDEADAETMTKATTRWMSWTTKTRVVQTPGKLLVIAASAEGKLPSPVVMSEYLRSRLLQASITWGEA